MSSELFLILIVIVSGFIILAFLIRHWLVQTNRRDNSLQEVLKSFDFRSSEQSKEIREQTKALNERLDAAARIFGQVQKNIGEFSEIGRSMQELQSFFKNPKLRGNIGEEILADLIGQMFPKSSFFLQHQFKNGARVDAAIKTEAGILPIDAKFPMENFNRMVSAENESIRMSAQREFHKNVRGHIEAISEKYILPDEGTLDFALMYIPSEQVFYEVVSSTELMTFAKRKRVYPVSPTTMYAHLQTILLSFAGKNIETKTKHMLRLLRALAQDYEKVMGNISTLTKHVGHAYTQVHLVEQNMSQLGQKLSSVESIDEQLEETEMVNLPASH